MSDTDALPVGETTADAPESEIPGLTAPEVETPAAETEPEQPAEQPQKMVPYDALHEERQRRKEIQQELQRDRMERAQRDAILEQRLAQLAQANQPKAPQVTYEDDPVRYLAMQNEATQQELRNLRQEEQRREQMAQRAWQEQAFTQHVVTHEQEFATKTPDYFEAINFAKQNRVKQLMMLGFDEASATNNVQMEAAQLAANVARQGGNPAQVGYEYAKSLGYQPKAAQATPEQKLQTTQKGLEASKSLSGGSAKGGNLSIDVLAKMSNEEFDAYVNKHGWEKVAG